MSPMHPAFIGTMNHSTPGGSAKGYPRCELAAIRDKVSVPLFYLFFVIFLLKHPKFILIKINYKFQACKNLTVALHLVRISILIINQ